MLTTRSTYPTTKPGTNPLHTYSSSVAPKSRQRALMHHSHISPQPKPHRKSRVFAAESASLTLPLSSLKLTDCLVYCTICVAGDAARSALAVFDVQAHLRLARGLRVDAGKRGCDGCVRRARRATMARDEGGVSSAHGARRGGREWRREYGIR